LRNLGLYAFDNLIRNSDRGVPKSNLILNSKNAYLIDHELVLKDENIFNIDFDELFLDDKFTKYHLFYHFLKKSRGKLRQNLFNDFSFYLDNLSLQKMQPYFNQLVEEGFNDFSVPFSNWIYQVKKNNSTFVTQLKGSLQ
jgi:hypothetical protein